MKKIFLAVLSFFLLVLGQHFFAPTVFARQTDRLYACCRTGIAQNNCKPGTGDEWDFYTTLRECNNRTQALQTYGYTCNPGEGIQSYDNQGKPIPIPNVCRVDGNSIRCHGGISQTTIINSNYCEDFTTPTPTPTPRTPQPPVPTLPAPPRTPTAPPSQGQCQNVNIYFDAPSYTVGQTVKAWVKGNIPQNAGLSMVINAYPGGSIINPTFNGVAQSGSDNVWTWTFSLQREGTYFFYVYSQGSLCPQIRSISVQAPTASQGPTCNIQATPEQGSSPLSVQLTGNAFASSGFTVTQSQWNFGYINQLPKSYYTFSPSVTETINQTFYQNANVTFTASDSSGKSASCSKYITVAGIPVPTPPISANTVYMQNNSFLPNYINTQMGQSITWYNRDSVPHTVTSDDNRFQSSGTINPGQSFTAYFTQPGTFPYHCSIHPTMRGTVAVGGGTGGPMPGDPSRPTCTLSIPQIGANGMSVTVENRAQSPAGRAIRQYFFDFGIGNPQFSQISTATFTYSTIGRYRISSYVVDEIGLRSDPCVSSDFSVQPQTPPPYTPAPTTCTQAIQAAFRSPQTGNVWMNPAGVTSSTFPFFNTSVQLGGFFNYSYITDPNQTPDQGISLRITGPNNYSEPFANGAYFTPPTGGNYTLIATSNFGGCSATATLAANYATPTPTPPVFYTTPTPPTYAGPTPTPPEIIINPYDNNGWNGQSYTQPTVDNNPYSSQPYVYPTPVPYSPQPNSQTTEIYHNPQPYNWAPAYPSFDQGIIFDSGVYSRPNI